MKLPVLAKLMLAERFNSRVFEQIAVAAAAASDGICPDLSALEAAAKKGRGGPTTSLSGKEDTTGKKHSTKNLSTN